jgi:hypothetical protein
MTNPFSLESYLASLGGRPSRLHRDFDSAECLSFSDGTPVRSPELLIGWLVERGKTPWKGEVRLQAFISHGRLVVECSACKTWLFTHLEWRLAVCGECGAIHGDVIMPQPRHLARLRALLLPRPRENQTWFPHESTDRLAAENREHGVTA